MKKIAGYDRYYATEEGEILSQKKSGMLVMKQWESHDGYMLIQLCKNGKVKSLSVHKLIAETFIPNPENKPEVNHGDGIRNHNYVSNLSWAIHAENSQHARDVLGKNGAGRKIRSVRQLSMDGNTITEYHSGREAELITGIGRNIILAVCKGAKYRKSAGGYLWEYAD